MGYFTRDDLPFYYTLADAFTICDAYHCSVLGPTDPNPSWRCRAPSTPPAGAGGEYLTMSPLPATASGYPGPVGLGFRVPCILMSPFTQGGFLATDVFDHTSTLRFIETLFGVPVPNLSPWRRSVTGDMTSALALGQPAATTIPPLPAAPLFEPVVDEQIILNAITGTFDEGDPYPPPLQNVMPVQETTPARPAPPR